MCPLTDNNVLNPFKKNTISVPRNLDAVTHYDPAQEADGADAGLRPGAVDAIWQAVRDLYRTGTQPGITLAIRRHGKLVLNRGIGYIRGGGPSDPRGSRKVPAKPDSPFCLFSASKALTAMAVHKLAEDGRLQLHEPVAAYIPEFAAKGKATITIAHLLSHRAGIPNMPMHNPPAELLYDWERTVELLCATRPLSRFGHVQAYHALTAGFILGELVQRITGKGLRAYFAEIFQKPMGFRYFNYGVPERQITSVARNYMTGPPLPFPLDFVARRALGVSFEEAVRISNQPEFMRAVIPAGNIVANADECCRFFQMLLNGGELDGTRILAPETIRHAVETVSPRQFDRTLMVPVRYSLGMIRGDDPVGLFGPTSGAAFGHLGFINILCWSDPRRALSVALLTNGKAAVSPHLLQLGRLLWRIGWCCPPVKSGTAAATV